MESADNTPIRGLAFGDFVLQKLMICKLCSNRYVMCSKTVIIGNFKRFYTVTRGARRIRSNPTIICGSGASDFPQSGSGPFPLLLFPLVISFLFPFPCPFCPSFCPSVSLPVLSLTFFLPKIERRIFPQIEPTVGKAGSIGRQRNFVHF